MRVLNSRFKQHGEFPMTVTGKIKKYEMREISKHELQLQAVESHFNEIHFVAH